MYYNRKYQHAVLDLLKTDLVSHKTKEVLEERLEEIKIKYIPVYFNKEIFRILQAISDRLIPQDGQADYIDLAASIDRRLSENKNNGWRFASLPPDGECYESGIIAINLLAKATLNKNFIDLSESEQDDILQKVQKDNVPSDGWKEVSPAHFFEELLAELTEAYYSHPIVQDEMGYVGMADMKGWKNISLNKTDPQEPKEIG